MTYEFWISFNLGNVPTLCLALSDGASGHFKNNFNILNLINHKTDFSLDACWTFTATEHGKGTGDGLGAILKSTARRVTLVKNLLLSTPKDFYEFSRQQQLTTAEATNRATPGIHVFFVSAKEVKEMKQNVLNSRYERLKVSGKRFNFLTHTYDDHSCLGTIQGIRSMHEYQPISNTSIMCRNTSRSSHSSTFTFQ